MLKSIFLALKKRINEETELPVYWYSRKRIDANDEGEDLFTVPSVHIEFSPLNATTMTRNLQQFEIQFNVHVVEESLYDHEKESLTIIDRAELVHSALFNQAFSLEYLTGNPEHAQLCLMNTIHRTGMRVDHDPTNLYITVMEYKSVIYDRDNLPTYSIVDPVSINIITELSN